MKTYNISELYGGAWDEAIKEVSEVINNASEENLNLHWVTIEETASNLGTRFNENGEIVKGEAEPADSEQKIISELQKLCDAIRFYREHGGETNDSTDKDNETRFFTCRDFAERITGKKFVVSKPWTVSVGD